MRTSRCVGERERPSGNTAPPAALRFPRAAAEILGEPGPDGHHRAPDGQGRPAAPRRRFPSGEVVTLAQPSPHGEAAAVRLGR